MFRKGLRSNQNKSRSGQSSSNEIGAAEKNFKELETNTLPEAAKETKTMSAELPEKNFSTGAGTPQYLSTFDTNVVVEDSYYLPYPQPLGTFDIDPWVTIDCALRELSAKIPLKNRAVVLAFPSHCGICRFGKIPLLGNAELEKVVEYEALHQIPFPLKDVRWSFRTLQGQDPAKLELTLVAVKRKQLISTGSPVTRAGASIKGVRLSNICLADFLWSAYLAGKPFNEHQFVAGIDIGEGFTNFVVTNGHNTWSRVIPIGGSTFTKQLMKEFKLKQARALYLKENTQEAEDPKGVFQAMRPVFNDLIVELTRSIGFFKTAHPGAEIECIIGFGGGLKLPGLKPYIEKNLELPFKEIDYQRFLRGPGNQEFQGDTKTIHLASVTLNAAMQHVGFGKLGVDLIAPKKSRLQKWIEGKAPFLASKPPKAVTAINIGDYSLKAVTVSLAR